MAVRILSESSVAKLPKLRESDSRQRSKTLDISSGLRKPRKAVDFPCSPATRFGHLSGTCQKAEGPLPERFTANKVFVSPPTSDAV
jgi:hypothetical protein